MKAHRHFLSKRREKSAITNAALIIAIAEPLFGLPQVIEIYSNQSAQDISLISWSFWFVASIIWFLHAKMIKDKALLICSALWVLIDGLLVIGILLYG
jgi:uncharacterized protein with PQ loop repeat